MVNRLLQRRNFPHPLQNGFDFLMPTFRSIYELLAIQSIADWTCHGLVPLHILMLSGYSFKSQGTFPT
jgi:hypothetical protein